MPTMPVPFLEILGGFGFWTTIGMAWWATLILYGDTSSFTFTMYFEAQQFGGFAALVAFVSCLLILRAPSFLSGAPTHVKVMILMPDVTMSFTEEQTLFHTDSQVLSEGGVKRYLSSRRSFIRTSQLLMNVTMSVYLSARMIVDAVTVPSLSSSCPRPPAWDCFDCGPSMSMYESDCTVQKSPPPFDCANATKGRTNLLCYRINDDANFATVVATSVATFFGLRGVMILSIQFWATFRGDTAMLFCASAFLGLSSLAFFVASFYQPMPDSTVFFTVSVIWVVFSSALVASEPRNRVAPMEEAQEVLVSEDVDSEGKDEEKEEALAIE
jgi:hypothetical protein